MAATQPTAFISQFSNNIHGLVEQVASKLRPSVQVEIANGEKHFFERLGSFEATEITERNQDTNLIDPAHSRRMATVRRYEASTSLDDIDKLKMLIDPTNEYAVKLARAHGRRLDDVILDAALGAASTGKDGSGSTVFDPNQIIAHGSTGLTVPKFNSGLKLLEANEVDVDSDRLYLAVGADGVEDLFNEDKLTSFDFQNMKALSEGNLPMFRGVNIIRMQRIPDDDPGVTFRSLLYTEDALKVAMNKDLEVKTADRPDKVFIHQVSTFMQYGAVRMEEALIVSVLYQ